MPPPPPETKRFLLCSSPKDADGAAALVAHLAPSRGAISVWTSATILPGDAVQAAVAQAAAGAEAALLLLSADFFHDLGDPAFAEQVAELRRQHAERQLRLVPILWRPCDWRAVPWLAALQPLPASGVALSALDGAQRDQALADLAQQLGGRERRGPRGLWGGWSRATGIEMPSRDTLLAKSRNLLTMNEAAFEKAVDLELRIHQVPQLVRAQHVAHGGARNPDAARPLAGELLDYVLRVERLLLVGQPGAGKTQTPRTLCGQLLEAAQSDPSLPVPLIVNLSTFSRYAGPLRDWLAEGLKESAAIPLAIGKALLDGGQLFLLLDGLDEMAAERRAVALTALNALVRAADPALARCVVCSRTLEYAEAGVELMLPAALELQPLQPAQIRQAVEQAGPAAAALHAAMKQDETLADLLQTPLLLTVAVRAFAGTPDLTLAGQSKAALRQLLYDSYVVQMLRRTSTKTMPAAQSTLHWMRWLAQYLTRERSSLFLIERLQPAALRNRRVYGFVIRLLRGLVVALWMGQGSWYKWIDVAAIALVVGLGVDLSGGMLFGLTLGVHYGLSLAKGQIVSEQVASGVLNGLASVLSFGLPIGLLGRLRTDRIEPVEHLRWSWAQSFAHWKSVLVNALAVALLAWVCAWMFLGPTPSSVLAIQSFTPLGLQIYRISRLLSVPITLVLLLVLGVTLGLAHFYRNGWVKAVHTQSTQPNGGIHFSVRNGMREGAAAGVGVVLAFQLASRWFGWLGRSAALWFGLGTWLAIALGGGVGEAYKHYALRLFLWGEGAVPLRLVRWLEGGRSRLLLRRQGGAYLFWHATLQDYFAQLDDTRLAELAQRIVERPVYVQSY